MKSESGLDLYSLVRLRASKPDSCKARGPVKSVYTMNLGRYLAQQGRPSKYTGYLVQYPSVWTAMSEGLKPVGRVVGGGGDLQALGALLKYVQSRYFVVDLHKLWCIGALLL